MQDGMRRRCSTAPPVPMCVSKMGCHHVAWAAPKTPLSAQGHKGSGGLGMRIGVQSDRSLTVPPRARGIRHAVIIHLSASLAPPEFPTLSQSDGDPFLLVLSHPPDQTRGYIAHVTPTFEWAIGAEYIDTRRYTPHCRKLHTLYQ